jgi:DNA polymerase III delta prime subunit|tara:strand:- start:241 stop:1182 length:942 start_codon:yes stop_codon:yes gene_type:complete
MSKDFLWVEKYRPQTISETILPDEIKSSLQDMVSSGELQNMLFTGTAGLGKTTAARALCNELNLDYIIINGSEEGNIDTLRGKIKQFASTVSLMGGYKVVILDEADYLNPQSTQPALRGFIEQFSDNCRFILTCNFKNRIIEPLHSRCGVYEFNVPKKDSGNLAEQFMDRLKHILSAENIQYNDPDIANLIMKYLPDWRRVINEVQRNCGNGAFNAPRALATGDTGQFEPLFSALKDKDFKKMRSWVVNNLDLDTSSVIRAVYDNMNTRVKPTSIPQLILVLADYQYKEAFVADHEINLVACLTEIMANADWN